MIRIELIVFDADRHALGIIEAYEYLRWTRRYHRCGSFELKALATPENLRILRHGFFLWKSDDEEAGIIENLELSHREQEMITASGGFLTTIMSRRIYWGTVLVNHDIHTCVQFLVNYSLMNPSNLVRKVDFIDYQGSALGYTVRQQVSYRNILDLSQDWCERAGAGLKTVFNPTSGTATIILYKAPTSQAVFSREYENLTEQVYTRNTKDWANTALIGGGGEGSARVTVSLVGPPGIERREIYVDARDMQQDTYGDLTAYQNALWFRGNEKLNDHVQVNAFDASVNPHGNLIYKQDFDIGQTVQVQSKRWDISLSTRITEIEESYDATGMNLRVVFGRDMPSLAQVLKEGLD